MSNQTSEQKAPQAAVPPRTSTYTVGQRDDQGLEIVHVYVSTPEYSIYRTKAGIRSFIDEDNKSPKDRIIHRRLLEMGPDLGRIYSLQPEELSRVESIIKQVARGMHQGLEGNLENARVILKEATERLIRLRRLQARMEYLISALVFAVVLVVVNVVTSFTPASQETLTYSQVLACGALGGFLSVAIGIWNLETDLDGGSLLNIVAGSSRIVIAAIAAVIAFFAVKSNFMFGALSSSGNSYGMLFIAAISGFSETFIPNVIKRIAAEEEGLYQPNSSRSSRTGDSDSGTGTGKSTSHSVS